MSYSAPVITSVSGCTATSNPKKTVDCARAGGTTITLQGTNFGASGATVLIGSSTVCSFALLSPSDSLSAMQCNATTHDPVTPHTQVTCVLQGDNGVDRSVILFQVQCLGCLPLLLSCMRLALQRGGEITSSPGFVSYLQCQPGYYQSDLDCKPCPSGSYQSAGSQSVCLQCATGTARSASVATLRVVLPSCRINVLG